MNQIQKLIAEAVAIQSNESSISTQALNLYKKAIDICTQDDDYELLYANYQIMWIYSNLYQIENAFPYAEKCLELLDSTIKAGAIMHFTDMGAFQEEAIRYASNVVAWYMYEHNDNESELDKALEIISLGCNYIEDSSHFFVYDTKVRILLKLGRTEEAYRIVYSCLKKDRDFADFEDFKYDNDDYRAWKINFESDLVTEYSDEEKAFLEKAARITANIKSKLPEYEKQNEDLEDFVPEKEFITQKEVAEKYHFPDYGRASDVFLLFKGDVQVKGDLDEGWLQKQLEGTGRSINNLLGIVVVGSITIAGSLLIDASELSCGYVYITGNILCDYILSYDGTTLVRGDVRVRYAIEGVYNDGQFDAYGKVIAPYFIASDHAMPRESSEGEFIYIEGGDGDDIDDIEIGESTGSGYGWDWNYFEDSAKLLSKAVQSEDGNFSLEQFMAIVRKGENPFATIE